MVELKNEAILKFEIDKNYSREVVTISSGQNLKAGSILGKVTEGGKYKLVPATEGTLDWSETAMGVLLQDVDATESDALGIAVLRGAIVSQLIYAPETTSELKKAYIKQLDNRGIITRSII